MVCPSHTYCALNRPKPSKCRVGFSNVNGQGSRFTRRGYRAYEDKFRLHLRHTLCNLTLHLFQHGQTLSSQVCEKRFDLSHVSGQRSFKSSTNLPNQSRASVSILRISYFVQHKATYALGIHVTNGWECLVLPRYEKIFSVCLIGATVSCLLLKTD